MGDSDKLQLRLGGIMLALLIAAGAAVVVFDNARIGPTVEFEVYFEGLAGLEENSDVHIAGRVAGRVTGIRLVPASAIAPEHPLSGTGGSAALIRLDRQYASWAPVNGEYFISNKGLLGEKYLEIGPPADNKDWNGTVQNGAQIRGIDPPDMDRAINRAMANLTIARVFIAEVGPEARSLATNLDELEVQLEQVQPKEGAWDRLVSSASETFTQAGLIRAGLPTKTGLVRLRVKSRATLTRLSTRVGELEAKVGILRSEFDRIGTAIPGRLPESIRIVQRDLKTNIEKMDRILKTSKAILATIERGEGTLGAIANDPEFSDDARKLGKILKRQPWKVFGHDGAKKPRHGAPPEPPDL